MSAYLFGNPPAMAELDALCKEKGLKHFCDSAHGMGTYIAGRPAGYQGDFEVFSTSPTNLLTAGEALRMVDAGTYWYLTPDQQDDPDILEDPHVVGGYSSKFPIREMTAADLAEMR